MADQVHWSEDPAQLFRFVERLETESSSRLNLDRLLLRLYHGRPVAVPTMDVRRPSTALQDIDTMKAGGFSLAREVGDAAAALVVRMPAIKCLPDGQHFKRQRGAKLMSRFLNGVFYDNRVKSKAPSLFIDEITTRFGLIKWFVDKKTKKMKGERMNSLWLLWDDQEGPDPKSLYYSAPGSKRWLKATYPQHAAAIDKLPTWEPTQVPMVGFQSTNESSDRVRVTEAWALPIGDQPGRHIVQIGRGADAINLIDKKWKHQRFPVVKFPWAPAITSDGQGAFGGKPLVEVIYNHHLLFNKITRIINECARGAVPKLMLHELAEVVKAPTDVIMETIRWRGQLPPSIQAPQTVSVDLWQWRKAIKDNAYELGGVNQQIAQGATSDNLKSAPAQRERMDIASTRLIHPTEGFEDGWRESAEVIVMLAAEEGADIKARASMGSWLSEVPFADIGLAEGEYAIEIQSTAALPLTLSGRLDFANDLLQMKDDDGRGLIKARDGLRMLQMPDTDSVLDRETAALDLADYQIEQALWEGNYVPPEPFPEVLDALLNAAPKELMRALQNPTFPDENLELCRRLIAEAKMLQKGPAPAAQAAPAPAAAPPGAPPLTIGAAPPVAA